MLYRSGPFLFSLRNFAAGAFLGLCAVAAVAPAGAAALQEPRVFTSQGGTLSVLMIAAKRTGVQVGPVKTDLWTYEVCNLPGPKATACPAGTGQAGLGGVRLAIQPGDTLRIRLVNNLPTVREADHIADNCYLVNNPTNLHTHGLIVEPHRATGPSDTYGDYVFVEIDNPANTVTLPGCGPGKHAHPGSDLASGAVDYLYKIEATHPSGLFWFHPHLHGLALNQVTAGMAGIITIGSPADACGDSDCTAAIQQADVQHVVLQDEQVLSGGVLKTQQEPDFCTGAPAAPRPGFCPGQNVAGVGTFSGGFWLHTVNGQVYPQINVNSSGSLWRMVNASASRSYTLSVIEDDGKDRAKAKPLTVQVISIDGITIATRSGNDVAKIEAKLGGKAKLVKCPNVIAPKKSEPVCATEIRMMPSSRVEVRLVRQDGGKQPSAAIFRTVQYDSGQGDLGDHWPAVDLASVTLAPRSPKAQDNLALNDAALAAVSPSGQLSAPPVLQVPGTDQLVPASTAGSTVIAAPDGPVLQDNLIQAPSIAVTPDLIIGKAPPSPKCQPLAAGHRRKILFGFPTDTTFGLGYVEVDQNGNEIGSTRLPSDQTIGVQPFDPVDPMVCVSLSGFQTTYEIWELVNITPEDHNFHIHQTRFFLLSGGVAPGATVPPVLNDSLVLQDNVTVPRTTTNPAGCDGTLTAVRSGACKPTSTFVVIPFRELGDFVFHCHILEHEDGGMMSRIRVIAGGPALLTGALAQ